MTGMMSPRSGCLVGLCVSSERCPSVLRWFFYLPPHPTPFPPPTHLLRWHKIGAHAPSKKSSGKAQNQARNCLTGKVGLLMLFETSQTHAHLKKHKHESVYMDAHLPLLMVL